MKTLQLKWRPALLQVVLAFLGALGCGLAVDHYRGHEIEGFPLLAVFLVIIWVAIELDRLGLRKGS